MAVKIRLSRIGKKHAPFYRIVAIDSRSKRDGASLEILGTYDPRNGQIIQFDSERIESWINLGAIPTEAVKKLQKKYHRTQAHGTA
jgi:small subunit ribosomal protein S16